MAKKLKTVPKRSRAKTILLISIGIIGAFVFAVQSAVLYYLYKDAENRSTNDIMSLIVKSADALSEPLVVDPQSGKQYVPSLRLVLPAKAEEQPGHVGHYASPDEKGGIVMFNSSVNLSATANKMTYAAYGLSLEERFEIVPKYQACVRQISLAFSEDAELLAANPIMIAEKTLADGRKVFIYEDRKCGRDANRLIDFVKQVESY